MGEFNRNFVGGGNPFEGIRAAEEKINREIQENLKAETEARAKGNETDRFRKKAEELQEKRRGLLQDAKKMKDLKLKK